MWYCKKSLFCFWHSSSWFTHQDLMIDSSEVFLLLACEDAHRMGFGATGGWELGRHSDAVDGVGLEVVKNDLLTVDCQFLGFTVRLCMSLLPNNQRVIGSVLHLRPLQEGDCWYGLGDFQRRSLETLCEGQTGCDQCDLADFENGGVISTAAALFII